MLIMFALKEYIEVLTNTQKHCIQNNLSSQNTHQPNSTEFAFERCGSLWDKLAWW